MTNPNSKIPLFTLKAGLLSTCIIDLVACGGGSGGGGSKSSTPASSSAPSSSSAASSIAPDEGMTMLRTNGTQWVKASGALILLKGTNFGNWLVQEFWMMGQGDNSLCRASSSSRSGDPLSLPN